MLFPTRARPVQWVSLALLSVSVLVCVAALIWRSEIRARYWAGRIAASDNLQQRAYYLTLLCNAGDSARWGVSYLAARSDPGVRQYAALALQHVEAEWAPAARLRLLQDSDPQIRSLAALALALRGDARIVPLLQEMLAGEPAGAAGACLALERLGGPDAICAIDAALPEVSSPDVRAMLVDALEQIDEPGCVPPLLRLLDDERQSELPGRAETLAREAQSALLSQGVVVAASSPAMDSTRTRRTIAERAAVALTRITGIDGERWAELDAAARAERRERWRDWSERASRGE